MKNELSDYQKDKLAMLEKGYGISASKRGWKKGEYAQMMDLVSRGLIRITSPAPWNKAGAFVRINKEAPTL